MSRNPRGFVVVGSTDYFHPAFRHVDQGVDSRCRSVRHDYSQGLWRSTCGAIERRPATRPRYLEFGHLGLGAYIFPGLVVSGQESAISASYVGSMAGRGFGYFGPGQQIYHNGSVIQSNVTLPASGDSVGVMLWKAGCTSYARFLVNGRRNILGFSEDLGNAAWQKLNSASASAQRLTFAATNSYLQQNISAAGAVDAQFTLSAWITSSHTMTFNVAMGDGTDGAPFYSQAVACVAGVRQRVTFSATMGAGYSGALAVQILGNGTAVAGSVVLFEELQVNAGLARDPYQKRTDAAGGYAGHAFAVTDTAYRAALSTASLGYGGTMRPDADDQLFPQPDCQPWGAAARVAERGGYSPAAAKLETAHTTVTLDAYGRTASQGASGDGAAYCGGITKAATDTAFYYVEFLVEDLADMANSLAGLVTRGSSISSYVGSTPQGWGYHPAGGTNTIYNNSAGVSIGAGQTQVAGSEFGIIWQPSSGKIWGVFGSTVFGDPQADTGFSHSNVSGDLLPAIAPRSNARVSIRTHAREQRNRPSYCTAWDGADLLPEQHFRGRLAEPVKYKREISAWPWQRGRSRGAPVSSIELANAGGPYDAVGLWDLRDEPVTGYLVPYAGALPERMFALRCDQVQTPSRERARVLLRDRSALLETRINFDAVFFGVLNRPGVYVNGANYVLGHNPITAFSVLDGGNAVTSRARSPASFGAAFQRTTNPAKRSTGWSARTLRKTTQLAITGGDFATWAGDDPSGWSVTETAPDLVTESAGKARFVRGAAGATVRIRQAIPTPTGGGGPLSFIAVKLEVTAYTKGSLTVAAYGSSFATALGSETMIGKAGVGTYWVPLLVTGGAASFGIEIAAALDTDLTIDNVEVWNVSTPSDVATIAAELLEDVTGFTSSDWTLDSNGTAWSTADVAPWSDQRPVAREVLEQILEPALADWWVDEFDVLHLTQLPTLEAANPIAFNLSESDIFEIDAEDDTAPALTDRLRNKANYAVHTEQEIDGALYGTAFERDFRAKGEVATVSSVGGGYALDPYYSHAVGGPIREGCLADSDINTPKRLWDHWTTRKRFYKARVRRSALAGAVPGQVGTVTHPRHGLANGKTLALISDEGSFIGPVATVVLWGDR